MTADDDESADCHLIDDGGPQLIAVEAACDDIVPQALWVRVGPVFYDSTQAADEPGIWVMYQERHQASSLSGTVLLTPAVWEKLAAAVDDRLARQGAMTRADRFTRAVRAVHQKYKEACAEAADLRQENERLTAELRRARAVIAGQNELVELAENVLGAAHHGRHR